ncbi:MAG: outer membrane beta-barrel protein, partial [Prevotella sp.]|nr:outer membrane beta-barrel protein [Prevotella sp.]
MKKLMMMAVAMLVASAVWAQNEKGTFSIKPMAGINVTGFSGGTVDDVYHYKVRFTAGLEAEYACNNWLGVSLGAVYSQQGANIDGGLGIEGVTEDGRYFYSKAEA